MSADIVAVGIPRVLAGTTSNAASAFMPNARAAERFFDFFAATAAPMKSASADTSG